MELTSAQRRLVFAVIVVVCVGLAVFLVVSRSPGHSSAAPKPSASPTVQTIPRTVATSPATTPQGSVNIYQWLPFSQAGLVSAVAVVDQFSTDYATYNYNEPAGEYVGRMSSLITTDLAATIERGYTLPGVAQLRTGQKQSASGTGKIASIRAFGPSSLTFLVALTQRVTGTKGTTQSTANYAVTVTGAGSQWQVSDIELASQGNF